MTLISLHLEIRFDRLESSDIAFWWAVRNFIRTESDLVVLINVRPSVSRIPFGAPYLECAETVAEADAAVNACRPLPFHSLSFTL